jgi:hypothetical protein
MTSVLTTLGAQTNDSFSDYGANTDYVSRYDPFDDYTAPLTGAIGDTNSRPIMFRYLQIYNTTTSVGALDLQIATAADATGGVQSASIAGSDNDPDWNVIDSAAFGPLQYAAFSVNSAGTNVSYYYGLQKNDASRVRFNTSATVDSAVNPNNIWRDGTVDTAFSGRVLAGRIGWYHVPNAPTSPVLVSNTSSSIALRWSHPFDDGITDSLSFGGLYGYRILYKVYGAADSTYQVFGSGTSGSPSGCQYTQGTSAYNFTTTPPVATPSSSNVFTTTGAYQEVTGLTSNTRYDFAVAGLNLVTDRHNGASTSIVSTSPTTGTRSYGNYTDIADHVGTNLIVSGTTYRTKLANPTTSGSYTSTANVNVAYSSNVTWSQSAGGGAVATTLTYDLASGSLTGSGLSLNTSTGEISGTPAVAGTYTFTVRATNLDSGTVATSSQTITIKGLGPLVSPSAGATPSTRGSVKVWNGTSFADGTMRVYDGTTPYSLSGWKYLK